MYSHSENAEYYYAKRQQRKRERLERNLDNFFGVRKEDPRPFFGAYPEGSQEINIRENKDTRKIDRPLPKQELHQNPSPVKIRSVVFRAEDNIPPPRTITPPVTPPRVHEYPGKRSSGKKRYTRKEVAEILAEETGKNAKECKKLLKRYKK